MRPGSGCRSISPTLLVLTRPAKPEETPENFIGTFLKRYPSASPATAYCQATGCLAFDIVAPTVCSAEGGGHFLAVALAEQPPEFAGLGFERPQEPPRGKSGSQVTYYHLNERFHRLPGVLYTLVELDSNESIFSRAAADFEYLFKSIQLD